jgi:hypothetical protein
MVTASPLPGTVAGFQLVLSDQSPSTPFFQLIAVIGISPASGWIGATDYDASAADVDDTRISWAKRSSRVARDGWSLHPTFPGWAACAAVPGADYCGGGKVSMITLADAMVSIHGCNGLLRTDAVAW